MEIIIVLAILTLLLWSGFHITGTLLSAFMWFLVKLPVAAVIFSLGMVCGITLHLTPIGLKCFKFAGKTLF